MLLQNEKNELDSFQILLIYSVTRQQTNKNTPIEWEKIFANNMTNKGLISQIYIQLNIKKKSTQTKNGISK